MLISNDNFDDSQATTLGLAIGIPLTIAVFGAIIVAIICWKRQHEEQEQEQKQEEISMDSIYDDVDAVRSTNASEK